MLLTTKTECKFQCIICSYSNPCKEELVEHLQTQHSKAELRRFNLDKLFGGKTDRRPDDWLSCMADGEIRFRAQHMQHHHCDNPACTDVTKRLQYRLVKFKKREDNLWHPYHFAEKDIALNKELQILLRLVYDKSAARVDMLQLKD